MSKHNLIIVLGILLAIIITVVIFFITYQRIYQDKIYPNIFVANINIGGFSKEEAQKAVDYQLQTINNQEIELNYDDNIISLVPSDLEVSYDLKASLDSAFNYTRKGPLLERLFNQLKLIFKDKNLIVAFKINTDKLDNFINELSYDIDQPLQEAGLQLVGNEIKIIEPKAGRELLKEQLKNRIIEIIGNLKDDRSFSLPILLLNPSLSINDAQRTKTLLEQIMLRNLSLEFKEKRFILQPKDINKWLELVKTYDKSYNEYQLKILFNEEKIKSYTASLAREIDRNAQNARLSFDQDSNTLKVLSVSEDGYTLKQTDSLKLIINTFEQITNNNLSALAIKNNQITLQLPVDVIQPEIRETNLTNLGIKEIISSATTNYAGSPENRRHNIATGAEIFQGVIIKPGEEFSFLKYLGAVSEERGFKKELVIKQDRTEPEVGGGLCQVSTTMFRAALNGGLKITERQNHKFRVSYYEPPVGLDATIYEPSPDLKFLNDTSAYILIESKITNNNTLTFNFFGSKDSRVVTISNPELYDYKDPPAPRYIDDSDMLEGETKYKEKAHTGVKAKVTYSVVRDGKEINKQTFYSTYVPWQAIIIRGTKKAKETPAPEATPTPESTTFPSPQESAQPTT